MDESPTNPHYHTLDGCTFIYTYIQNTQIIVAQFLHMGELTPQQLTKSLNLKQAYRVKRYACFFITKQFVLKNQIICSA